MRVIHTPRGLTVKDSPGMHWLLGGLFIVVGAVFLAAAFGAETLAFLAGGVGAVAVATGVWVLRRAPRSVLTIEDGVVRLRGESYRTADIDDVRVVTNEDDESNRVYQVHLVLRDGGRVPVSRLWIHDRDAAAAAAQAIATVVTSSVP